VIEGLASHGASEAVAPIEKWAQPQATTLRARWLQRQRDGKVREGHGDLHLANTVVLDDDATAFDCIEFDPALRWIDVQADIAFLVMDLIAHGRPDLAFRFLDRYLADTGDQGGLSVLRYYMVYRALVRAMVTRLRPAPPAGTIGPDYLATARRLMVPPGARLLITHGVSGSGKSHAAERLLERCGAIRLRSDVERKRLHGLHALQGSASHLGAGIYSAEGSRRTYSRLRELASDALTAGWPVIVDAAFLQRPERDAFRDLARQLSVPFSILHCEAPPTLARARLRERATQANDPSEADAAVLEQQLRSAQPLHEEERVSVIDLPVDASSSDFDALAARWLGST
jgi:predicted kinase